MACTDIRTGGNVALYHEERIFAPRRTYLLHGILYLKARLLAVWRLFVTFAAGKNATMAKRTSEDFYKESKRIREEVLQQAELLKGSPLRFTITNEITMRVEITKTDLKTIVSKNVGDDKFNAIKNALAKDIPGYLAKATYLG